MRPLRTHSFNGKNFKIIVGPVDGLCIQSDKKENSYEIFIMYPLSEKNGLITAIHEALHASDYGMSEEKVDRMSTEIGNFLWRMGYRWRPPK